MEGQWVILQALKSAAELGQNRRSGLPAPGCTTIQPNTVNITPMTSPEINVVGDLVAAHQDRQDEGLLGNDRFALTVVRSSSPDAVEFVEFA
jgi:hypothetical protein